MMDFPQPHIEPEWHHTLAEDYARARSDDERRRMLLRFGYDKAHEGEVVRLFGALTPEEARKKKAHEVFHSEEARNFGGAFIDLLEKYWPTRLLLRFVLFVRRTVIILFSKKPNNANGRLDDGDNTGG